MSDDDGSVGRVKPVRGMAHCVSSDGSDGGDSRPSPWWSSNAPGSTSRSGSGGESRGREFVRRRRSSLHMALILSSKTTALQRAFSPLLLAAISHNSSVYCIICSVRASLLYAGDF